jgi:hypothetical protein
VAYQGTRTPKGSQQGCTGPAGAGGVHRPRHRPAAVEGIGPAAAAEPDSWTAVHAEQGDAVAYPGPRIFQRSSVHDSQILADSAFR